MTEADQHPKSKTGLGQKKSDVDGPWAWVVLCATVSATILGAGQIQSVHIYYNIFLQEFKTSSSYAAWVPAAQNTAMCAFGPLVSFLLPKLGARLMIIAGSFIMATCFVLAHFATSIPYLILIYAFIGGSQCFFLSGNLAAISIYFRKRAPLAIGIMLAGSGVGAMIMGIEIEWSVETFGWRGAMLIQSAMALNVVVSGSLVFKMPRKNELSKCSDNEETLGQSKIEQPKQQPDDDHEQERTSNKKLLLDYFFWICVLSYLAVLGNFATLQTIFKRLVIYSDLQSSFKMIVTALGLGNMAGRLLAGTVSNILCPPIHIFGIGILGALVTMSFLLATIPWTFTVVSFLAGFCQGQLITVYILKVAWIFGQKQMPVVRGYATFFGVISGLAFPPIVGYTVDITGNYISALCMASGSYLFCGSCGLFTYFITNRQTQKQQTPNENGQLSIAH